MAHLRHLSDLDFIKYGFDIDNSKKCPYGGTFFKLVKQVGVNHYNVFNLNWIQYRIIITKIEEYGYDNSENVIFNGFVNNKEQLEILFEMLKISNYEEI